MANLSLDYSLAVTISVYDRFLELAGLLELLRLNWPSGNSLHITVITTATKEQIPTWFNKDLTNVFRYGSDYPMPWWDKVTASIKGNPVVNHVRHRYLTRIIRARTLDSIIRGCKSGMKSGASHTLHLHAAAWPLDEKAIFSIIDRMKELQAMFACRGFGLQHKDTKRPYGDIDDNFFIINNAFAAEKGFWDFDPAEDALTLTNEGRLARRVFSLCAEDQVYFFDKFANEDEYVVEGSSSHRQVQPYNFHKPLSLLRSHDLKQQAYYSQKFNLHGPTIERIMKEYSTNPS